MCYFLRLMIKSVFNTLLKIRMTQTGVDIGMITKIQYYDNFTLNLFQRIT